MSKKPTGLFIDCGGHVGESIMHFKKSALYNEALWNIHSFEPCDELTSKMLCRDDEDVTLHQAAVWTYDGRIDFYMTEQRADYYGVKDVPWGSSTLMKGKTSGGVNADKKQTVPCIDLAKFINEQHKKYDYVVLKMDIEGAEYDVLEHLFESKTIEHIHGLLIEYHHNKVGVSLWRHLKTKFKLKKTDIFIIEERKGHVSGSWFNSLSLSKLSKKKAAA